MAWLGSQALNRGKRTLLTRIIIAAALGLLPMSAVVVILGLPFPNLAIAADHEFVSPDAIGMETRPAGMACRHVPALAPPVSAQYAVIHGARPALRFPW
jgi:hypothetical protein